MRSKPNSLAPGWTIPLRASYSSARLYQRWRFDFTWHHPSTDHLPAPADFSNFLQVYSKYSLASLFLRILSLLLIQNPAAEQTCRQRLRFALSQMWKKNCHFICRVQKLRPQQMSHSRAFREKQSWPWPWPRFQRPFYFPLWPSHRVPRETVDCPGPAVLSCRISPPLICPDLARKEA